MASSWGTPASAPNALLSVYAFWGGWGERVMMRSGKCQALLGKGPAV